MAATPWATIDSIAETTGKTVTATERNLAAQAIELATGAIELVVRIDVTARDLYWLKLAVCYQAAWLASQADYLERSNVMNVSQDGMSATGAADWLTLGPMARKAVKRLSWKGSRTLSPRSTTGLSAGVSPLISDAHGGWKLL